MTTFTTTEVAQLLSNCLQEVYDGYDALPSVFYTYAELDLIQTTLRDVAVTLSKQLAESDPTFTVTNDYRTLLHYNE